MVRWGVGHGGALEHCAPLLATLRHGTELGAGRAPTSAGLHCRCLFITAIFEANVEAQGGAYATGVLVPMSSAALAVALSGRRRGLGWGVMAFGALTAVFVYTTVVNIIARPEGIKIAAFFIGGIVLTSLISRVWRSTEVRIKRVEVDATA